MPGKERLNELLGAQWLLTNGLGGYALGTALAGNRSRYHGWLIAAARPPVERRVVLHSIAETIRTPEKTFLLNATEFGESGMLHPDGHRWLRDWSVTLPHTARWRYECGPVTVMRELHLLPGRNAARIRYAIGGDTSGTTLHLRPLMPMRDFHELTDRADADPSARLTDDRTLRIECNGCAATAQSSQGTWRLAADHWRDFAYAIDRDRGQPHREDVWSPGVLDVLLSAGASSRDVAVEFELIEPGRIDRAAAVRGWSPERVSEASSVASSEASSEAGASGKSETLDERLARAAEQFLAQRDIGGNWSTTILAGFPWFADWGRDAMIALPGLLLETHLAPLAAGVLSTFSTHCRNGLIPNRFDDYGGEPHYNTVDASLWFIRAVGLLHEADEASLRSQPELRETCRAILHAYERGTDFGIRMDDDGLIAAGSAESQLTWMDAQRDGVTFTPRHGKPVEINALWHHAWHVLARLTDDESERQTCLARAREIAAIFREQYWWESAGYCHDVVVSRGGGHWTGDETLRPNQILAVALAPSPLTDEQQRRVVNVIAQRMLTPFGLRTLNPSHPGYRGRFTGTLFERDAAYHQGTVWPWLVEPYIEAVLRTPGLDPTLIRGAGVLIRGLESELERGCLGQLAEVHSGDAPFDRGGCCAQAWSLAALIRSRAMLRRSGVAGRG